MHVKHLLNEKEQQNPSFNHSKASQSPYHSDAKGYSVCQSWGLDPSPSLSNKTILSLSTAVIVSLEEGCGLVFSVLGLGQECILHCIWETKYTTTVLIVLGFFPKTGCEGPLPLYPGRNTIPIV
jgi:hypothetical protein